MTLKKRLVLGFGLPLLMGAVILALVVFLLVHHVEGGYFDSNGVRIHYTVQGQGEPLILVHGVGANIDLNWRYPGVIRRLAKHFKVIALDLRGHGLSDKPTEIDQYGIQMVEDIPRLMDHLRIPKAHVAGYSLGGFITLKLLATHPDRVASAAICAAGWKDPEDPSPLPNPYKAPVRKDASPAIRAGMSGSDGPKTLFHGIRNWVGDQLMDKKVKKALKQRYIDLAVDRTTLEKNQVPTLCIIGDEDGLLFLAYDLRAHLAHHEFVEISGAGHFTTPFRPKFKNEIEAFFQKHAGH